MACLPMADGCPRLSPFSESSHSASNSNKPCNRLDMIGSTNITPNIFLTGLLFDSQWFTILWGSTLYRPHPPMCGGLYQPAFKSGSWVHPFQVQHFVHPRLDQHSNRVSSLGLHLLPLRTIYVGGRSNSIQMVSKRSVFVLRGYPFWLVLKGSPRGNHCAILGVLEKDEPPKWLWLKNMCQNRTLIYLDISGTRDQSLRNPSSLILSHTQMGTIPIATAADVR